MKSIAMPPMPSPKSGPHDTRPRLGLSPTSPHALAGMRIDPPPSLPWAAATIPAATAAAEPPLDPPGERLRSHGLRVGPYASGSVVAADASSGTFVRPMITQPVRRSRRTTYESSLALHPASRRNLVPS